MGVIPDVQAGMFRPRFQLPGLESPLLLSLACAGLQREPVKVHPVIHTPFELEFNF